MVLNNSDSVIYATPLKGSNLAYLVTTPLPIAFNISKNNVTKMVPEVLSVESFKSEDFGYYSFSFDLVKTFDFLVTVMVYNFSIKNWELTMANIVIRAADSTIVYNDTLKAITNQITLRDNSVSYILNVSKAGYQTYTAIFTADELKLYFKSEDKGPLIIRLSSVNSESVTEIDGNIYHAVVIGTQVWMAENLKTTKYNDDSTIPNVTDNTGWVGLTSGAYCWYNNDAKTNKNVYGALYNWYAVNTGKLCPIGWHVPTVTEWTTLGAFLGGDDVAGGKMKEADLTHWSSPNTGATNESGFTGLPGGLRGNNMFRYPSTFGEIGRRAFFWTSTEVPCEAGCDPAVPYRGLGYNFIFIDVSYSGAIMNLGFSVRCVKN
jgi:uncharacterized protein (TIGR02145 family)